MAKEFEEAVCCFFFCLIKIKNETYYRYVGEQNLLRFQLLSLIIAVRVTVWLLQQRPPNQIMRELTNEKLGC